MNKLRTGNKCKFKWESDNRNSIEKNKSILQTCSVKAKNKNKDMIIRFLLNTESMKSFVFKSISDKLQLHVI